MIERGVADVLSAVNQSAAPKITLRDWCKTWLKEIESDLAESTFNNYHQKVDS